MVPGVGQSAATAAGGDELEQVPEGESVMLRTLGEIKDASTGATPHPTIATAWPPSSVTLLLSVAGESVSEEGAVVVTVGHVWMHCELTSASSAGIVTHILVLVPTHSR